MSLATLFSTTLLAAIVVLSPADAQKVYVGTAGYIAEITKHLDQWVYVQQNADGFYANFIMLDSVIEHTSALSSAELEMICRAFVSHAAYLESDIRTPILGIPTSGGSGAHDSTSVRREQEYIRALHNAGCKVLYTSLNYGWSADRAHNLTGYELQPDEGRRLNFVQTGAWVFNGDIKGPPKGEDRNYSQEVRDYILQSDGISTDGPMGFWKTDFGKIREATISLVKFAHANSRRAMVMIAPYGANQTTYDPNTEFLTQAKSVIHTLEVANQIPDIYVVFEYATPIHAVPEEIRGQLTNTTMGVAYWLIHHIHDHKDYP
jgi:hypothetical protein